MLTGELVRVQQKGRDLNPSFVDPQKKGIREVARAVLTLFEQSCTDQATRALVEQQVDWLVADRRDHKMVRGLAKICFDRSTFDTQSPLDAPTIRDAVFTRAAALRPLALAEDPLGRPDASTVYREVADALGVPHDQLKDALYADLKSEQRLHSVDVPDETWLVDRYNVALVQALLLKAESITVKLNHPSPPRLRQLFRQIKFHQLIHEAWREDDWVHLRIDGPTSLFQQSTRYGMQLAVFFPALLLQTCDWHLDATVRWTRRRLRKTMTLTSEVPLVSHYRDQGAYLSKEQQLFQDRFNALDTPWKLDVGQDSFHLGGRSVWLPDFVLKKGNTVLHLEVLGYWRPEAVRKRIRLLNKYGPKHWLIAVSRKRRASKASIEFEGPILEFAEILSPKKVIEVAESL